MASTQKTLLEHLVLAGISDRVRRHGGAFAGGCFRVALER